MGRWFKLENGYRFQCMEDNSMAEIPDHLRYLIDDQGEVYQCHDVHAWARKFAEQHRVAWSEIQGTGFSVSTVFLGVMPLNDFVGNVPFMADHCLFETIVFGADGKAVDGAKHARLDAAKRGHEFILARWRKSLGVDPA
jgi:hypothetical protein